MLFHLLYPLSRYAALQVAQRGALPLDAHHRLDAHGDR
jgi:hypothetical protein